MPLLSLDELKALVEKSQAHVSIICPCKAGPDVRQNPIRFKNLIREAEERLDAMEIRHTEAVDFLKLMNLILLSSGKARPRIGLYLQKCFSTTVFRLNFKNWWLLAINSTSSRCCI